MLLLVFEKPISKSFIRTTFLFQWWGIHNQYSVYQFIRIKFVDLGEVIEFLGSHFQAVLLRPDDNCFQWWRNAHRSVPELGI